MGLDMVSDINRDYAAAMDYGRVDRFMIKILWWHFGFTVLLAYANSYLRLSDWLRSPFSWRVLDANEALAAASIGLLAAAIPAFLRDRLGNHYVWRLIMTAALTTYSYVFVFLSGGSIELHFHFFMVMALITVYADWRLGWLVLVLAGLHHGILNYVAPKWVYVYGRNDLAVVAHALPVAATAIFTTLLCINHRQSVAAGQAAHRALEREMEERIRAQEAATTDALTGLANRRALVERLYGELLRSARSGSPLSIVSIDLDGFKVINETHGHATGDQVLSHVAGILRRHVRQTDLAARHGGEEFILLFSDTAAADAKAMLGRFASATAPTEIYYNGQIRVQFCWGLSSWPEDGDTPDQLIQAADHRLREMKRRAYSTAKVAS